jgi:hypothetical protein
MASAMCRAVSRVGEEDSSVSAVLSLEVVGRRGYRELKRRRVSADLGRTRRGRRMGLGG